MSNLNTQWRITVAADTARARTELAKFAKVAQATGSSMEQVFSNVQGAPVARTFNNMGRELNRMNAAVQKSKVHMGQWNRYWQNSNNLIRYSKQLQTANTISIERTNGAMTSATAVMKRFNAVTVSTTERLAYMNTFFRAASRNAINAAKNIQWSGRQITVGFGIPFGLAMTGASMAFLKFEEQLVRFRKVFNEQTSDLNIEEAEERITSLANTMSTTLGVARDEIMETSALFAQMGYGVEEIERLTRATTELAMLGETDAQEAGKLLRAYSASGFVDTFVQSGGSRDEFEDYIKNMLNMIENNTGLSIGNMVESGMAQLIPLFSQMGIGSGIGESILAGMSEALGGRTSEAVTALKAIMQRVYDESAETTEQFGLIGIDIDYLQNKYTDDFVGLITELGNTLANNPAIQNNNKAVAETFGNLFGVRQANRAIAGLRAVSGAFDESGNAANDYGRALNAIEDPAEAASRAQAELKAQAESVGGQLRRLKEAILIEAADIGEFFLEMIMPLIRGVRNVIEWFGGLSDGVKRMAIGFGLAVVAIGGLLTTMGVLTQAVLSMTRFIGFFLPKFQSWTEENLRQRIALNHVNEAMRGQRDTINSLVPLWKSIERAQHSSAQATREMTKALMEQQAVARGAGAAYGGVMSYGQLKQQYPGRAFGSTERGLEQAERQARRAADARFGGRNLGKVNAIVNPAGLGRGGDVLPGMISGNQYVPRGSAGSGYSAPLSGVARARRQADLDAAFGARGGRPSSGMMAGSMARNNRRFNTGSAVKWRTGATSAGGLAALGGSFIGGDVGNAMVGGGMGVSMLAQLSSGKLVNKAKDFSKEILKANKGAKGLASGFARGGGHLLSMAATVPGIGLAAAAIGVSAFLIAKNIKEAREEASLLRNEFVLANDVGEELGLQLEDIGSGLDVGSVVDSEEFENMSDNMQSMVRTFEDAQEKGSGYVQSVARNLARQWQAGGASIEDINDKLNELEAIVDVNIDPVSLEMLSDTIETDITRAISMAMENFTGNDRFWEFFTNKEFNAQEEQMITNAANAAIQGMQQNPENAAQFVQQFDSYIDSRISTGRLSQREGDDAKNRFGQELARLSNLPEALERQANSNTELAYIIARANIDKNLADGFVVTENEIAMLESLADALPEDSTIAGGMFNQEDAENVASLTAELGRLQHGLAAAGFSGFMEDTTYVADNFKDASLYVEQMKGGVEDFFSANNMGWDENLTAAENLRQAIASTNDETEKADLQVMLDALLLAIDRAIILRSELSAGEIRLQSARRRMQDDIASIRAREWETGEDETDDGPAEDAGTEDANKYASAFRSEMDGRRNEVVQAALENFDEISEARMDRLKQEKEDRLELLEEQRDDEIEALEDARDAELDALEDRTEAIDEYIDKQKELQETLQQQIDLNVALASGDRGKAAQIQNAMRFGEIEEMAKAEKERIGEAKDQIRDEYTDRIDARKEYHENRIEGEKELFDTRMDNEKRFREQQRENMEEQLKDLDAMFLGTEEGWNDFIAEVEGITNTRVNSGLADGWNDGMDAVRQQIRIDNLWDQMAARIGEAVRTGITDGITQGLNNPKVQRAYAGHYTEMARQATARAIAEGVDDAVTDTQEKYPVIGGGVMPTVKHSGGPIGPNGAPKDVPAILQTGEYVIQRKAAQALGPEMLAKMNSAHKYHSGGAVANSGFLGVGQHIGSIAAQHMKEKMKTAGASKDAFGPGGTGFTYEGDPMPTSQYGPRTWGRAAPNTLAAQDFIQKRFDGVRGAYASVGRGDPKSDHSYGKALDVMTAKLGSYSNEDEKEEGWKVAQFFQDNPKAFGTKYVIWQGLISSQSVDGLSKWRPYTRLTGPTGGHYDHVHVSFLHGGGEAGKDGLSLMKGGRLKANNVPAMLHKGETVLRAPVAKSLEAGIQQMAMSGGGGGGNSVTVQVGEFHGTEDNIDKLAQKVCDIMDKQQRRVNPTRRFG